MLKGPYQMWRVVGTPPSSSSPPSVVISKFRSTFWLGNYIWSLSYGFGVVVKDIWEWRPGFYTEFRYKSYEHSGLAWGAIFEKVIQNQEIHTFWEWVCLKIPEMLILQEQKPRRVLQNIEELFRLTDYGHWVPIIGIILIEYGHWGPIVGFILTEYGHWGP